MKLATLTALSAGSPVSLPARSAQRLYYALPTRSGAAATIIGETDNFGRVNAVHGLRHTSAVNNVTYQRAGAAAGASPAIPIAAPFSLEGLPTMAIAPQGVR